MIKITDIFRDEGSRRKAIVIMGVCAIVLIMLSSCSGRKTAVQTAAEAEFDSAEYTLALERRLEEIISGINGAGETRVMVTLATDRRLVYALEESSSVDSSESSGQSSGSEEKESSVIIVKGSDGERPLVVTSVAPQINGVLVVCDGGDDPAVIAAIEEAVTTVLGINSRHVCITKLSKNKQEEK